MTFQQATPASRRNPEIQSLRAVAVLLVLGLHYPALLPGVDTKWYGWVVGWWSGVDLFFCISGFVITRGLLSDLATRRGGHFGRGAVAFWVRRWYRIVPAAWLWMLALLALNLPLALAGDRVLYGDFLAALLNFANYHFYRCTVDAGPGCQHLHVYWSLSLEEQFYLLMPLLLFVLRRWLGMAALLIAVLQMMLARTHWVGLAAFFRTDAIFLGVFLACAYDKAWYRAIEPAFLRHVRWPLPGLLLVVLLAAVPTAKPFALYMGAVALISAVLVWLASYDKGYLIGGGRARDAMVWIGERSFSIYLGHVVTFALTQRLVFALGGDVQAHPVATYTALVAGALAISVVLVDLSYRYVEGPWRRRGHKRAQQVDPPRQAPGPS